MDIIALNIYFLLKFGKDFPSIYSPKTLKKSTGWLIDVLNHKGWEMEDFSAISVEVPSYIYEEESCRRYVFILGFQSNLYYVKNKNEKSLTLQPTYDAL